MKRNFMLSAIFALGLGAFSPAANALTIFSGEDAVITGIITDIAPESFTLRSDQSSFVISLADLDLNTDISVFLKEGARVAIRGRFDDQLFGDPVIEAREVLMVNGDLSELDASKLLLYDRNDISRLD